MQHLSRNPVIATLVIEVRPDLALTLSLVLVFVLALSLAFVLAFPFAFALVCKPVLEGVLGLVDDLLFVAVRTADVVRARLSVAEVKARKQLLLFRGRGESSRH